MNGHQLPTAGQQLDDSKDTNATSTSDERGVCSSPENPDFLLSNSFSNVSYQRYGLHIEEGQSGKYQPLPEAQSELLPPDKFIQVIPILGASSV